MILKHFSPCRQLLPCTYFNGFFFFLLFFLFDFIRIQTTTRERKKSVETTTNNNVDENSNIQLDENSYRRARINDFFSQAFGPSQSELKTNQPHSIRSTFENFAGEFIQKPARGSERETLDKVKDEMRKKKIRINTKQ